MALPKLFLSGLIASSLLFVAMGGRPSPLRRHSLAAARLQSDSTMECWDSLLELRACAGEVLLFFLNGETYLGPSCCRAISTIEHRCWPSMLTSLGFTPEEGDILKGYCDASDTDRAPPPTASQGPTTSSETTAHGVVASEDLVR